MKKKNDRLDILQELGQLGIWEWYFDTKDSWVSYKVYELFGEGNYTDGYNPRLMRKYASKESNKLINETITALLNGSEEYDIDIQITRPDNGEIRDINVTGTIIYSDDGTKEKVYGIVRDITESQFQKRQLEIAKENFRVALDESPVPTFVHAEDGEFLFVNKATFEETGYEFYEINTLKKWIKMAHPNRVEYNEKFVERTFNEGVVVQGEHETVVTKSGEEKIWEFHNAPLGLLEDGRKGLITVCIDITEKTKNRREQEKLLYQLNNAKTLLQASLESPKNMIILSFDKNYNYYFFNPQHKKGMKELYNVDVEMGMNVLECIKVDADREKEKINYDRALDGESHSVVGRYGPNKDNYFETYYNPIKNNDDVIIGAVVFTADITKHMVEVERIKESEEKFRLLYSSMSQGLAVHEIITDENNKPINYSFLDINESYSKLFNYKREDVIGKTVREVAPLIEQYWIDVFGSVALTGVPQYYENYSCTVDMYLATYSYSPKIGQFAVLISDISDRIKQDEEIKFLSYNDQLTGVFNRRYYEEQFIAMDVESNYPLSLIMGDVNGLKLINDSFGHLVGDELLKKVATILKKACRGTDIITRIGGDEFVVMLPNTSYESTEKVIERINKLASEEKAESIDISISFGFGTKINNEQELIEIFKEIEDEMYRKKLNEGASMRSKTIDLIMTTLYEKNNREMLHSKRVSTYCELLAINLNLEKDLVSQVKTGGLMHDIGKIGINDSILNKIDKLSIDEWKEVKKHSEIGYRILSSLNEFSEIADHILEHHENWDGSGYPKGLKEEEISLQARIICIADAYDAMTGPRPYKDPVSKEEAILELIKYSGIQFDPEITKVFIEKVLK